MLDQADHRGPGAHDREGDRQVPLHPGVDRQAVGSRLAPAGEVEVDPPQAEADHERRESGRQRDRILVRAGQPVDHSDDDLAQDDDHEQVEPLDHRVGRDDPQDEPRSGAPAEVEHQAKPADHEAGPHDESCVGRQRDAGRDHDDRHGHRGQVARGDGHELGPVLAAHGVPQPGHDDEEPGVHDREGRAARPGRVGRVDREQREDGHLDEDERPGAAVLAAVELVVERPVRPRDPDDAEDDDEFEVAAQRHVTGELVRRLRDDDDIDEVVEQLEEADGALGLDLAVRPRRPPEPASKAVDRARSVRRDGLARHRAGAVRAKVITPSIDRSGPRLTLGDHAVPAATRGLPAMVPTRFPGTLGPVVGG